MSVFNLSFAVRVRIDLFSATRYFQQDKMSIIRARGGRPKGAVNWMLMIFLASLDGPAGGGADTGLQFSIPFRWLVYYPIWWLYRCPAWR